MNPESVVPNNVLYLTDHVETPPFGKNDALDFEDVVPGRLYYESGTGRIVEIRSGRIAVKNADGGITWFRCGTPPTEAMLGKKVHCVITVDLGDETDTT